MSDGSFARPAGAGSRRRARLVGILLASGIAAAMLASPASAPAADDVNVRVMTRNVYLGADLTPAINADSTNEFVVANGQIVRDVETNNFPVRARGLAQEILDKRPDVVGLQEVALWRYGPLNNAAPFTCNGVPDEDSPFGCDFTASTVRYDFLRDLLRRLNEGQTALPGRDLPAGVRLRGAHRLQRRPRGRQRLPGPVRRRGERSPDDARRHSRPHRSRNHDERQGRPLRASLCANDRRHSDRARRARLDSGRRDG